jgi:hypothetical protein
MIPTASSAANGLFQYTPRALHHHHLGPALQRPRSQRSAVALERAELTLADLHLSVVMLDNGARGDLGLVNIQRYDALMHRGQIHCKAPAA